MDGGDQRRNKRKVMEAIEEQQKSKEEEDEEEKMEKFYALIRSTREIHDFIRRNNREEMKKTEPPVAWNPSFQPEDFLQSSGCIDNGETAAAAEPGPSNKQEQQPEEEEEEKPKQSSKEDGKNLLDLNLSL